MPPNESLIVPWVQTSPWYFNLLNVLSNEMSVVATTKPVPNFFVGTLHVKTADLEATKSGPDEYLLGPSDACMLAFARRIALESGIRDVTPQKDSRGLQPIYLCKQPFIDTPLKISTMCNQLFQRWAFKDVDNVESGTRIVAFTPLHIFPGNVLPETMDYPIAYVHVKASTFYGFTKYVKEFFETHPMNFAYFGIKPYLEWREKQLNPILNEQECMGWFKNCLGDLASVLSDKRRKPPLSVSDIYTNSPWHRTHSKYVTLRDGDIFNTVLRRQKINPDATPITKNLYRSIVELGSPFFESDIDETVDRTRVYFVLCETFLSGAKNYYATLSPVLGFAKDMPLPTLVYTIPLFWEKTVKNILTCNSILEFAIVRVVPVPEWRPVVVELSQSATSNMPEESNEVVLIDMEPSAMSEKRKTPPPQAEEAAPPPKQQRTGRIKYMEELYPLIRSNFGDSGDRIVAEVREIFEREQICLRIMLKLTDAEFIDYGIKSGMRLLLRDLMGNKKDV